MPVYTAVRANGKPAVLLLNITRQPSGNTVAVANGVAAEIAQLQSKLPPGVHLEAFYDQLEPVLRNILSVRDAILIGLVLACIILFLFLDDWTSSLVAGLVIPVTVAVTILFLRLTGQSFNLMTLGGLAAAIGLVIDDAIVVVENIAVHREAGESRIGSVRKAIHEISRPLFFSTITPVIVFLPLVSVTQVNGKLLPRSCRNHDGCFAYLSAARSHLHSGAVAPAGEGRFTRSSRRPKAPEEMKSWEGFFLCITIQQWGGDAFPPPAPLPMSVGLHGLFNALSPWWRAVLSSSSQATSVIRASAPICCRRWMRGHLCWIILPLQEPP